MEQHTGQKCPHCGYPIEVAEHAPGCPSLVMSKEGMSDEKKGGQETLEQPSTKETRDTGVEKIKRAAKRLVLWGVIASSAPTAFGSPPKEPQEEQTGKVSLSEFYWKLEDDIMPRLTNAPEQNEPRQARIEVFKQHLESVQREVEYLKSVYGVNIVDRVIGIAEDAYLSGEILDQESFENDVELVTTGFEKVGISSERFKELCKNTYPKNWILNEVDSVVYIDKESEQDKSQHGDKNMGSGWKTRALARTNFGITTIDVFKGISKVIMSDILAHEFGHANDWEKDNNLTVDQRVRLFAEVTKRYTEGKDIYQSSYVESINNPDPTRNLNLKVTEYWAVVCSKYFSYPEDLRDSFPDDYDLVDRWVKLQDPDFDPIAQAHARDELIAKYKGEFIQQLDSQYTTLPADVRKELDDFVERLAFEIDHDRFMTNTSTTDVPAAINEFLSRHQMQLDADDLEVLVFYRVEKVSQETWASWNQQFVNEIIEHLPPDAYQVLRNLKEEEAGWNNTLSDVVRMGLEEFRKKYHITEVSVEALHNFLKSPSWTQP